MLSFNPQHAFLEANGKKIGLDSACAGSEAVFVSHAHFDHAPSLKKAKRVLATRETIDLLEARGIAAAGEAAPHSSVEGFDGLRLELLPSGHVLGSTMLYAEDGDGGNGNGSSRFLYTSDFKTRGSLTAKTPAAPRECDTLVIESTYGLPDTRFPDRKETYEKIAAWTKERNRCNAVVLAGYALGKAQELVACLNEYAGITPVVSPEIARVNEVYARHGVKLDYVNAASPHGCMELRRRFVAVLPPKIARCFRPPAGQGLATAFASGWCSSGFASAARGFDAGFALSDHADFPELVGFVEKCAPKRVYCVHGYAREFARALRAQGFNASAAGEEGGIIEKTLLNYQGV